MSKGLLCSDEDDSSQLSIGGITAQGKLSWTTRTMVNPEDNQTKKQISRPE